MSEKVEELVGGDVLEEELEEEQVLELEVDEPVDLEAVPTEYAGDYDEASESERRLSSFGRATEREYHLEMYEPGDYRLKARVLELSMQGWKYPATIGFRPPNLPPFVILAVSRDKLA